MMNNMMMKFKEWLGKKDAVAWYVHTNDGAEGYYVDSLDDEWYLNDKKHYDAVAIKVDLWD